MSTIQWLCAWTINCAEMYQFWFHQCFKISPILRPQIVRFTLYSIILVTVVLSQSSRGSAPGSRAPRLWLAGCSLHATSLPKTPRHTEVNGHSVPALLDSGSTITLIRPTILPQTAKSAGTIPVSCIYGEIHSVPPAQVQIRSPSSWGWFRIFPSPYQWW